MHVGIYRGVATKQGKTDESDNRASQALRAAFQKRGTQTHTAKSTGISQGWLARLAQGRRPEREHAMALKKQLGIELEWWDEPPLKERKHKGAA